MNLEEYINAIYKQIIEEITKGHEHLHLCKYCGVIAVRQDTHSYTHHFIIHKFSSDELRKGFTSKGWESLKQKIEYVENHEDDDLTKKLQAEVG